MNRPERTEPAGKAAKIIEAARDAFFEQGYDAISMDEVAKRAGVAKQTVYSYYSSKDALFAAVHARERESLQGVMEAPPIDTPDAVRSWLREIGLKLLEILLSPSFRALFRVTVAAAHRFPSLGKEIYEEGILPHQVQLTDLIRKAEEAGALQSDDPRVAAQQFLALMRGELYFHCIIDPSFEPSRAATLRQVEEAVDCFLAKYGTQTAGAP